MIFFFIFFYLFQYLTDLQKQEKLAQLQGHWHIYYYEESSKATPYYYFPHLDIRDSIGYVAFWKEDFKIFYVEADTMYHLADCSGTAYPISFRNDTLIIKERHRNPQTGELEYGELYGVKKDKENCDVRKEYIAYPKLNIDIPSSKYAQKRDSLLLSTIFVGVPEDTERYGTKHRIRVNDAFIAIKDVPRFVDNERDKYDTFEKMHSLIELAIDKDTKMDLVDSIRKNIPYMRLDISDIVFNVANPAMPNIANTYLFSPKCKGFFPMLKDTAFIIDLDEKGEILYSFVHNFKQLRDLVVPKAQQPSFTYEGLKSEIRQAILAKKTIMFNYSRKATFEQYIEILGLLQGTKQEILEEYALEKYAKPYQELPNRQQSEAYRFGSYRYIEHNYRF